MTVITSVFFGILLLPFLSNCFLKSAPLCIHSVSLVLHFVRFLPLQCYHRGDNHQGGTAMSSDITKITTRTDDEKLKPKLQKIARKYGRSLSREVEQILKRYIEQYEKAHGEIKIDR